MIENEYRHNSKFRAYVDKYCTANGVTVEQALKQKNMWRVIMTEREITIGVTNECQGCDLMKNKSYHSDILPYCTLFKTFLQFREYENDNRVVKPCFECYECSQGNTHYFRTGEWNDEDK